MKLAFCAIVKGDDKEADVLANLLANVTPHVDGTFITITQPNEKVKEVAEFYGATVSHYEWNKNFSMARNYNLSQVTDDYDFILWGDADDEFVGLENIKKYIEENKADGYYMHYHYDFDEYGATTALHKKTMVVVNDGTFTWLGGIHEDMKANREVSLLFFEDILRIHKTNDERVKESAKRNYEIAKENLNGDPRDYWNMANACTGIGDYTGAIEYFVKFIDISQSDIERYTALLRIANMYIALGDMTEAESYARKAIGEHFDYPDAFYTLATVQKHTGNKQQAIETMLEGLKKKPAVHAYIVFNPRDYDYNPLMMLANLYWDTAQPEKTAEMLKLCKKVQPKNKNLDIMIKEATKEARLQKKVIEKCKKMREMDDKSFMREFNRLKGDMATHPLVLQLKNMRFVKTETSGKDLVYYCGQTTEWTPDILKKGIGGSEEAVINLTKEFAKAGYNVTVYNNCGTGGEWDGVTYKPWYTFNYRDKQDIFIAWRNMRVLDYDIDAKKIFVDIHDAIQDGEFTKKRLAKIDKVFLKSEAHYELFPSLPREKTVIVPNAIDTSLFKQEVERDPYLIINTSSPDRSLSALIRIFNKIKAREPRAKMKWAYGFDIFDMLRQSDKNAMAWKKTLLKKMEDAGIENLGKISHEEVAKLTLSAGVYLYPTHFYEIDCVSVRKAQLGGAHVVSSDFAALKTTNKHGYKVHSLYNKDNWCPPYAIDMGDDPERDYEYVEMVMKAFENNERTQMVEWASKFTPEYIAKEWLNNF